MEAKKTQSRARKTGRYTYSKMEVVCVCGSPLSAHDAEAPHANGDLLRGPECDGFKKAKG